MSLKIFGLNGSKPFAEKVSKHLSIPLSKHVERDFDDSEIYVRADENVRGSDVYVIHSLYGDGDFSAGEKLASLAFFIGSLKDASASRITVVCPYLAYARQDRKTESRAPIGTKYVAQILEAMGVNRLLTMDVHNLAAFQNAFRIPTDNLEAKLLLVKEVAKSEAMWKNGVVVLSPDAGGMPRTRAFRQSLEKKIGKINQIGIAYLDKERDAVTGKLKGDKIIGDVKDKDVIIIDDMIASGSTIKKSAEAIVSHGGRVSVVCATHGLFIGDAAENLSGCDKVFVADTIPPFRMQEPTVDHTVSRKIHVVDTAELFAKAIRRNHDGDSISQLLED
jgi:ribose-phosphate pyrophosphokinase